jgi:hypothetical protein
MTVKSKGYLNPRIGRINFFVAAQRESQEHPGK